jgi:hypothetical protein
LGAAEEIASAKHAKEREKSEPRVNVSVLASFRVFSGLFRLLCVASGSDEGDRIR